MKKQVGFRLALDVEAYAKMKQLAAQDGRSVANWVKHHILRAMDTDSQNEVNRVPIMDRSGQRYATGNTSSQPTPDPQEQAMVADLLARRQKTTPPDHV